VPHHHHLLSAALACGLLVAPLGAEAAAAPAPVVRPVTTFEDDSFGRVLATRTGQALYWWNRERDGHVRCTGSCARGWPPLIVPKRARVPAMITGVKGRLGTTRRPDGRRQVTYQGRPLSSYAHEGPRQVLCNNVDGWFVARARGLT
jgi:predicted lipoprotein with Yx(FWY)xxD motif